MKTISTNKAFTLIELLIVVAIIAILAAIAVPNFLEAQTRSKVSRARADMRTLATAFESYYVDNNRYPLPHGNAIYRFPGSQQFTGHGDVRNRDYSSPPPELTTPIAYLSSMIPDVFKQNRNDSNGRPYYNGNPFDASFVYHPVGAWAKMVNSGFDASDVQDYGLWRMFSLGPDGEYNTIGTSDLTLGWIYDPTNGTISSGLIIRTQADTVGENFSRAN